ncbi:uncharacterized protein METZ01_LOCUS36535 [marine metagenome]|uniref:CMP/dCMP-type deaminase domain-containing protein n=1 Tax=marine metagenome TaxID=408172 RepID=A0A381QW87_9ZZZZ
MKNNSSHEFYMSRCIEIAKKGIGTTFPNPCVGCIIVYNNTIISEAFSSKYGGNHAEINAIKNVKEKKVLKKSTLYVTLEPCSHFGKTPPCCNTIINYEIPNVVIGTLDNSPKVNGKGIRLLKKRKINVIKGVLEKECKELHKVFLHFNKNKRPFIILKWAQSKNKFIAPLIKEKTEPYWITSKKSRQLVHKWRSEEHGILIGHDTVICDNPILNIRNWKGINPVRIVIDLKNNLKKTYNVFNSQANTIKIIDKNIDNNKSLSSEVSNFLFKKKIQSVIIEGGKKTLQEFIRNDLWDEARIFTNKKKMNKGLKAPNINGKIISEKIIDNDKLEIIRPN